MENDNVYPLNGEYFTPTKPVEQQTAEDAKRQSTLSQLPLLNEVVAHLNTQIAFYESVKSIPDEVLADPEKFMHAAAANKLTAVNLTNERNFIETRVKNAKP